MADDKKNINIDIKNAIHQQAVSQNKQPTPGITNPMSKPDNDNSQSGLKDVISQFADIKKLLSQAIQNSKNTFTKLEKNVTTLIDIEKQNSNNIAALNEQVKSVQKNTTVQNNKNIVEYDQKDFIQHLKSFFEQINTKLILIKQDLNNQQNTNTEQIDLSLIESSIQSSTDAIIQKLQQITAQPKSPTQLLLIIDSLKAISDKLPENFNNDNSELVLELQNIKDILNTNSNQQLLLEKLDIVINALAANTPQNVDQLNNISKDQIDNYFNQIISTLQKKNQDLSYSATIDISNLQNSFNIFLQNLKNQNSLLAQQIITQQLKITSSGALSQTSAYDLQTLAIVQEKLSAIALSLQQFKNSQASENKINDQISSNNISISMALSKLDNSTYIPPTIDIDKLSNDMSEVIKNEILQNNTQEEEVQPTTNQIQTNVPQQAEAKLVKTINKTVIKKQSGNSIIEFGQTLKNQFFNLISNINLFNQNQNNKNEKITEPTQTTDNKSENETQYSQQNNQVEQQYNNLQNNENQSTFNEQEEWNDAEAQLNISDNSEDQQDESLQIQANVLNNQDQLFNNSDIITESEPESIQQNNLDLFNVQTGENQPEQIQSNDILYDINNSLNAIKQQVLRKQDVLIAVYSTDNSQIGQAIAELKNQQNNQLANSEQFSLNDTQNKDNNINLTINYPAGTQNKPATSELNQANQAIQPSITFTPTIVIDPTKNSTSITTQPTTTQKKQPIVNKQEIQPKQQLSTTQAKPNISATSTASSKSVGSGMQNTISQLTTSIFGENILSPKSGNASAGKNDNSGGIAGNIFNDISNSVFGGMFNRNQLSKEKQAAVEQISTKQQQMTQITTQASNVQLQLAEIDSEIELGSSRMEDLLDNLDDNQEYRELLDNSQFLQLCKSQNLQDINKAIKMCDDQFQRLNTLKDSAKDKDSVILQQKNVNQVKKQLVVQKSNIEKQQKHRAKAEELQNRMKQTQVSINQIKKDANLTQDQIKVGLENKDNPMNDMMNLIVQAFAQMLGVSTGNSQTIQLSPENITEKLKQTQSEQSQQQLISNAFKKYTSIKSGNPIVDGYLNNYVKKRFDDIQQTNPDMSKQQIDKVGNALIKQFEAAWDSGYVLVPSEDGSTYSQIKKETLQSMQQDKQPLILEDIAVSEQINDMEDQIQLNDAEQPQLTITTTEPNIQTQQNQVITDAGEQSPDMIYIDQNQYNQDMNNYIKDTMAYQNQVNQRQNFFKQWKSSGSDEISQLLADAKNNYVIHQINKLAQSGPIPAQQQHQIIQSYQKAWDNNLNNNIVIYTQDNEVFKSDKDQFLHHYFDNNISPSIPQPTQPMEADYIIVNPSEQQINQMNLQPYTQTTENNQILDANGQVVQPPPKEETLPDTIEQLQKQTLKQPEPTGQKTNQNPQTTIGSVLSAGGNIAEAYRNQENKKQQKTLQNQIGEGMLQGYSKMLGLDVSQLSDILGSQPPESHGNIDQSSTTNISNNISEADYNVVNAGTTIVDNVKNSSVIKNTESVTDSNNIMVTNATTNPETKGSETIKKLVESDRQKNKQQKQQKKSSADSLQNMISTFTTTVNNNNTTSEKEDNSDKLLQGIATLVQASKPQVIYIWPSEKNDPPKINTIINI